MKKTIVIISAIIAVVATGVIVFMFAIRGTNEEVDFLRPIPPGEEVVIDFSNQEVDDAQLISLIESGEIPYNVTNLNLSENLLTDASPLSSLVHLRILDIGGNSILNIAPLAGLRGLTSLNLWRNGIHDITPLEGLTNLTWLRLQNNMITDLSPLAELTYLEFVDPSLNPITDFTPVSHVEYVQGR
jgi:Leucine-rich repeat (LRR) protein